MEYAFITDILLAVLLLFSFPLLGLSFPKMIINLFVIQGALLGLIAFLFYLTIGHPSPLISLTVLLVKAAIIPFVIYKTINETNTTLEIRPYIPFNLTIFIGIILMLLSFQVGTTVTGLPPFQSYSLSVAISIVFFGVLLIISRRNAIYYLFGYMLIDNGIFILTLPLFNNSSIIIEMLLLVDVLVAITVRRNAIFWISKEFSTVDIDHLDNLKG